MHLLSLTLRDRADAALIQRVAHTCYPHLRRGITFFSSFDQFLHFVLVSIVDVDMRDFADLTNTTSRLPLGLTQASSVTENLHKSAKPTAFRWQ
ncbi:hypothetical protein C1X64_13500 [Pseudomonas sp. GW456-E7]|nr:hypothetical protein C1X64_13500 [Pseudomonas sp. GW456-E7]